MLRLRPPGIVLAIAFAVLALPNPAATQSADAPKGPPDKGGNLLTDCQKMAAPKFTPDTLKEDILKIRPILKDGRDKTTACINAIRDKLTDVLKRKQSWDHANKEIDELIGFSESMIQGITGPSGIRALIEQWIDKTKRDKNTADRLITDPIVLEAQKRSMDEDIQRAQQSLKRLDEEVKNLSTKVSYLESKKPEYAFLWYREEQKQIIDSIVNLADGVRQQAEALSRIEFGPKKATGN